MSEKFRLNIVGAEEDVPRVLLAYGRGCGGEVAFVMRPRDNTALLVHQIKKQPAKVWRTDLGLAPSHAPELDAAPADAVTEIRRMKGSPPPAGPATLKGKWAGTLYCDDGTPRMVLERRVASYGVLKLSSKPDGRWTATFERMGKWFSQAKQQSVERSGLSEAITAGMGIVVGLVSEACSFRDTHRRNTVDADFAAQHPPRPAPEVRDPTERYKGKSSFRAVEQADGWAVVNDVGSVVAKFGAREKGKAEKHASALTRGQAPAATVSEDIASGFGLSGMPGLNVIPSLADVPLPTSPKGSAEAKRDAAATEKEADALADSASGQWVNASEVPELLTRAAKLLRHAEALVKSPMCSGKEQKMAWEDLRRGAEAYNQVREALERGEKPDILTTLRRIAERVSLAAARAAKSCAAGQQKITKAPRSSNDIATGIGQREAGWVWGDRVTWQGQTWIVQDVRADGSVNMLREGTDLADTAPASQLRAAPARPSVSMQPVWPPAAAPQAVPTEKKPRTRKAKAPEVDPAKDQALVNAFADAIKQAAQQMGGGT
ncbi:MAG: hypothetical protein Q8P41_18305 [Pseudomonadota bacterium]|nr:hypothetical protein [Pseudomonadota bacterium]